MRSTLAFIFSPHNHLDIKLRHLIVAAHVKIRRVGVRNRVELLAVAGRQRAAGGPDMDLIGTSLAVHMDDRLGRLGHAEHAAVELPGVVAQIFTLDTSTTVGLYLIDAF